MLTIEQYIAQMKKKDNLDEFNFMNHAENLATVMKYVVEYFNTYLNPEQYNYEAIKLDQAAAKVEKEISETLPESKEFVINYYKKHQTRVDRMLKGQLKSFIYHDLFYSDEDFEQVVDDFCNDRKKQDPEIFQNKEDLMVLVREIKEREANKPSRSGYKQLDEGLASWISDTYMRYKVNLLDFAQGVAERYYDKHMEHLYDRQSEHHYHINRYNHRYNENPFRINEIYQETSHRPFIEGRKGELEILIMHEWIFDWAEDSEYWPEYVNLCVATGRVNIVRNMNMLLPVIHKGVAYPPEIISTMVFVETSTGALKTHPGGSYILRLGFEKDNDAVWKNDELLSSTIRNMQEMFDAYGPPYALELLSPLRSPSFNEQEYFARYSLLEKKMKKYPDMTIALVNGPQRHKAKPSFLMQTTEDVIKIRALAKEMKFRLKFSLDFSKLIKSKNYHSEFEKDLNQLSEIRHSIVGVHLANNFPSGWMSEVIRDDDSTYLNQFDYPRLSGFLSSIVALLSDNQCRYFIPEDASSPEALEELVDNLLRGGFSFVEQRGETRL
ncbi:MAG: hypothetical protein AB9917_24115 [Negativicutes bacterium]